ncbi:DNA-directed RNA polymerase subunit N [uncultured archaeon]|nr:DNA-directed RNA polymerase subunit N [uncultured archaeon]
MIIPIRCMSCGKVVADKWETYKKEVASGKSPKKVLDELGLTRYCCRSLFLTHVDMIEMLSLFKVRNVPLSSGKEDVNIENLIGKHLEPRDGETSRQAENE